MIVGKTRKKLVHFFRFALQYNCKASCINAPPDIYFVKRSFTCHKITWKFANDSSTSQSLNNWCHTGYSIRYTRNRIRRDGRNVRGITTHVHVCRNDNILRQRRLSIHHVLPLEHQQSDFTLPYAEHIPMINNWYSARNSQALTVRAHIFEANFCKLSASTFPTYSLKEINYNTKIY